MKTFLLRNCVMVLTWLLCEESEDQTAVEAIKYIIEILDCEIDGRD